MAKRIWFKNFFDPSGLLMAGRVSEYLDVNKENPHVQKHIHQFSKMSFCDPIASENHTAEELKRAGWVQAIWAE